MLNDIPTPPNLRLIARERGRDLLIRYVTEGDHTSAFPEVHEALELTLQEFSDLTPRAQQGLTQAYLAGQADAAEVLLS